MIDPSKRHLGIIYASITAFLWGFLAIALKVAVNFISPYSIVWFRFLVAFLVLALFFTIKNPSKLKIIKRPPVLLIVAAICLGLNYIGFMLGIQYTTPGNTQIIIQLGPILLAVVGILFFKETLSKRQLAGFIVAGIGFLVFYNDQLSNLLTDKEAFNSGILFIIFGAIAWVIYATFQKKLVSTHDPQQLNLIIYGIPALLFLPFIHVDQFYVLKIWQWILLVLLGLNTLIAYGSLAMAFKYVEANKISIIITVNPIITFIVMALLAEFQVSWIDPEVISLYGFGGALLVLTGAGLVVWRPGKNIRQ